MILAEQFLARIFRDLAEFVVDEGYRTEVIGNGDNGVLIERRS